MMIPSPSAMMMNRPQRSAMWLPEMSQSDAFDRPRPGTGNSVIGPRYSITTASSHQASRSSSGRSTPISQNGAAKQNHTAIRIMLRALVCCSR